MRREMDSKLFHSKIFYVLIRLNILLHFGDSLKSVSIALKNIGQPLITVGQIENTWWHKAKHKISSGFSVLYMKTKCHFQNLFSFVFFSHLWEIQNLGNGTKQVIYTFESSTTTPIQINNGSFITHSVILQVLQYLYLYLYI